MIVNNSEKSEVALTTSKFFLVGCPRSGTTLLQSLLASHPQIASFPESHFFECLISDKQLLNRCGLASRYARPRLEKFIEELKQDTLNIKIPKFCWFLKQNIDLFVTVLNTACFQQNKTIWVEKTPGHLKYIDTIAKFIPQAQFIHLIRNGEDVVASLYEVSNKYPQYWNNGASIDQCIEQWNTAITISQKYQHQSNHLVVLYQDLVKNTAGVLQKLCHFMGVDFTAAMLQNDQASAKLILNNESWKHSVSWGIINNPPSKFKRIFDSKQQSYIQQHLLKIESKVTV